MFGSVPSKKMEILKKKWWNYEIDWASLNFLLKILDPSFFYIIDYYFSAKTTKIYTKRRVNWIFKKDHILGINANS